MGRFFRARILARAASLLASALPIALAGAAGAPALAFDLPGLVPAMGGGPPRTTLKYSGTWGERPEGSVDGIRQESLALSAPVLRAEKDQVLLGARASWLDPGSAFPGVDNLYDLSASATYSRQLGERRSLAFIGSFGSASDKPFKDGSVDTVSATALWSFPDSPTGQWLLLLNYSNNRPILNNIPLPGFAYSWFPSRDFRLTAGVPFASVNWRFAEGWSLSALTVVPWVLRSTVARDLWPGAQAFAGFDFSQQTFYRFGREDSRQRIFYDEKRLSAGLKAALSESLSGELEAGASLDRRVFEARNYRSERGRLADLGSGWLARLGLELRL